VNHGHLLGCPKLYPKATEAYPCRASGLVQIANALIEHRICTKRLRDVSMLL
jgi:hypothetical protein